MSWIKVENTTPNKPEILRLSRLLGVSRDDAFGKAMRFWIWIDGVSVDGRVDGVASPDVDAVVGAVGVAAALAAVGWLQIDDENHVIHVPHFERHNGESAKARGLRAKRQAKWRGKRVDGDVDGGVDGAAPPDKRREDKNNTPYKSPKGDKPSLAYTQEFERWWQLYPKKVGKESAARAFRVAKKRVEVDELLTATERYAGSPKGRGEFCWNPTTWLNQAHWLDDPKEWQESRGDKTAGVSADEYQRDLARRIAKTKSLIGGNP